MKCPCCKYEQRDTVHGYVDVEKVIKSGKRKGETKVVKEWRVIEQPVGDNEFESIRVVAVFDGGWGGSYSGDLHLIICPKCGVTFKEII